MILPSSATSTSHLLNTMNEAVVITDSSERISFVNKKYLELSGYTEDELIGTVGEERWDRESFRRIALHSQLRKKGLSTTYEAVMITKKEEKLPVLISGSPLSEGGTIGIITDLSEVKQRESIYQRLVENMNESVIMTDKNRKSIFANAKFCELTGYSLQEIIGDGTAKYYDPESAKHVEQIDEFERKKGIASRYEASIIKKTGEKIPVLISGAPLEGGGTIGIITDLSEMKKRESIYMRLVSNITEAVWMGDSKERTLYANPKFCELVGYALEEIKGKVSYSFWDKESAEKVQKVNLNERKKGISSRYFGNLLSRTGEKIPVMINGTPLSDGGTIGIITDLRDMKEKERREKMLSMAIQYTTDAIIIFDHEGKITSWNKGAKIMFGWKEKEMIHHSIKKLFSEKPFEEFLNQKSVLYNVEFPAKDKNGTKLTISATVTPIVDEGEKHPSLFLLIARDVTHHIKIEEEITLKYQKIKDAYNQFGIIRRQMDYLFELLDLSSSNTDTKMISDFVVSSIIMLTRVDACILRIYNEQKDTLELISSFGVDEDWRGKVAIRYKNSLAQKAYEKKYPLKIIDVTKEARYQSPFLAKKMHLTSLLLIPLQYKGKILGTLSMYANPDKKLEIFENEFVEKYAKLIEMVLGMMYR